MHVCRRGAYYLRTAKALDSLTVFQDDLAWEGRIMRGSLGIWLWQVCSRHGFDRDRGKRGPGRQASIEAPNKSPLNIKYFAALNVPLSRVRRRREP